MIERFGWRFAESFAELTEVKHLAALYDVHGGQPPEPNIRALAKQASMKLRTALILADMEGHLPSMNRLDSAIGGVGPMPLGNLAQAIMHTLGGVRDDLQHHRFFHVDLADVGLYNDTVPFGEKVSRKFPKAIEDIAEAAKCLSFQSQRPLFFTLCG